jgi:hypothetical protein
MADPKPQPLVRKMTDSKIYDTYTNDSMLSDATNQDPSTQTITRKQKNSLSYSSLDSSKNKSTRSNTSITSLRPSSTIQLQSDIKVQKHKKGD